MSGEKSVLGIQKTFNQNFKMCSIPCWVQFHAFQKNRKEEKSASVLNFGKTTLIH